VRKCFIVIKLVVHHLYLLELITFTISVKMEVIQLTFVNVKKCFEIFYKLVYIYVYICRRSCVWSLPVNPSIIDRISLAFIRIVCVVTCCGLYGVLCPI
jgi:hypothetical protein